VEERLQKVLAARGVASRRAAEELIKEGRVQVNGRVVDKLGTKVDTEHDQIEVDGCFISSKGNLIYILLYKPAGFITSVGDPRGRRTVMDLLPQKERIYPVGRLDYETSGLLLLTNDGELTNGLLHPGRQVDKIYRAGVKGEITEAQLNSLREGIELTDGRTWPAKAKVIRKQGDQTIVQIAIHEGRNRQVRRMLAAVDCQTLWLKRIGFAGLELGSLKPGEWRELTPAEINNLKEFSEQVPQKPKKKIIRVSQGAKKGD